MKQRFLSVHRVYETCVQVPITPEEEAVLTAGYSANPEAWQAIWDWFVEASNDKNEQLEFSYGCSFTCDEDGENEKEVSDW